MQLRWQDNTDYELGYRIQMYDKATKSCTKVGMAGRNHTAAVVTGLQPANGYSSRVQAIGKTNTGRWQTAGGTMRIGALTESTDGPCCDD